MIKHFAKDVKEGLSQRFKSLPSKYFYDSIGSALFTKIMELPEYYLTNAEYEIFSEQRAKIIKYLDLDKKGYFELIELGAGDGYKTIELLKELVLLKFHFNYLPIDISQTSLNILEETLQKQLPDLHIQKKQGDYFHIMKELKDSHHPKVVLFLGSNMGNMTDKIANHFIARLSNNLSKGDKIILGADLIKSAEVILPAYNDSQGVTRDFNLNLLERINRELDGNFDLSQFEHKPEYDEKKGIAQSFLMSKTDQEIYIKAIDLSVKFYSGEKIATEISRKYNDEIITKIAKDTHLKIIAKLTDSRNYYADYILEKQS